MPKNAPDSQAPHATDSAGSGTNTSTSSDATQMPERLRQAFENLVVGCQILDRQLRYIYINAHAAMHGRRPKEELLGKRMVDVYPGIESTHVFQRIEHCLQTGLSERLDNSFQYPDGSIGIFELSLQAIPEGILIASVDVTSERQLAERLVQSQKMEAVGRLAGGVAHDFNNLLTVIKGHCDLLQAGCSAAQQQDSINAIRSAGQRAARLTRQLLSLSRHSQVNIESVDLNYQLRKSYDFMQSLLGAGIQLRLQPHDQLPLVKIDTAQFEQTIMNLVLNARDAMLGGGVLSIATSPYERTADQQASNSTSDPLNIRLPEMKPGHYVYFRVTDNGVGMSPETQSRMFEPFFTTKEVGRGTGLGLSVVHGAVQRADGYIAVTSEPGVGSTFHIFYPAVAGTLPVPHAAYQHEDETPQAPRIVLVEDEDSVRKIVCLSLEKNHFHVIQCNSAEMALALLHSGTSIDLLITDVVMPNMRGPELAQTLLRSHPHMRILYMSGYADESMGLQSAMRPVDDFLQKPFSPMELLQRVKQLLAAAARSSS